MAKNSSLPTLGGSISNNANFGQNITNTGIVNRTDNYNNSIGLGLISLSIIMADLKSRYVKLTMI